MTNHQGQFLAALPRNFHALRGPFLQWAAPYGQPNEVVLGHLRRALIGWYEASIDQDDPYTGQLNRYVQQVAEVYFSGKLNEAVLAADRMPLAEPGLTEDQNPLNHLPRPIHLNTRQQLMLAQSMN